MWTVIGASERGASHAQTGRQCEDAYDWRLRADGALLIAVADGAGSASYSRDGAVLVTRKAVEAVDVELDFCPPNSAAAIEEAVRTSFSLTGEYLADVALQFGISFESMASTLILVVASPSVTAVGQVGDGAVVGRITDGAIVSLSSPVRAEYINQTTFLTTDIGLEAMAFGFTHMAIEQIAVMTDGIQSVAFDLRTDEPFDPFFSSLFRFAKSADATPGALSGFLTSPRLAERTDDDTTIVIATRHDQTIDA